jgi:hypothetical protein
MGESALFQNRGSSPATLESSKIVDAFGLIEGNDEEVSDAPQAYTQEKLRGTETWVVLPTQYWPDHFHNIEDPVVPRDYSLYGHPDAGTFWEDKSHSKILSVGFKTTGWESLFWHPELRCLLMVYVGDFRMSGPKANLPKVWARRRSGANALTLDEPKPPDRELGCYHRRFETTVDGMPVRAMEYDMRDFMRSCVDKYLEVTETDEKSLKRAETPFLAMPGGGDTPPDPEGAEELGELTYGASSILMKLLYGARLARWDLLRAIGILSSRVTKWSKACDKSLHRLMCYVNTTVEYTLTGYVGKNDRFEDLHRALYPDADLAGDRPSFKSTMGNYTVLQGPKHRLCLRSAVQINRRSLQQHP